MRRSRKKYKRPKIIWNKARIKRDKELKKKFGLLKKHEIWAAETLLRKYRHLARRLAATKDKKTEKELIEKLAKFGLLEKGAGLDDVLSLAVEDILGRRLQTIVFKNGFAHTPKEARQFIVHGHVKIVGRRAIYPSYLVPKFEEEKIEVVKGKVKSAAKELKESKPTTGQQQTGQQHIAQEQIPKE